MTTQTEELKPCPFCGGEAELIIDNDHHGEFFQLGCKDKECLGHWAYYTESIAETPVSEAIAHWNTRALAQQSNEQVEPVTLETVYETIIQWDECGGKRSRRELARRILSLFTHPPVPMAQPKEPEQEPVATVAEVHMSRYTIEWTNGPLPEGTKLYTTPPQRKPLTDEQITQVANSVYGETDVHSVELICIDFARAIEAAHGIKGDA